MKADAKPTFADAAQVPIRAKDYLGDDPVGFVLSANLHRRHLNETDRAFVGANICNLGVGANQHTAQGTSIEVASKYLNVGRASIERAKRILKYDPQLADKVKKGDVSLSAADKLISQQDQEQIPPKTDGETTKTKTTKQRTKKTKKGPNDNQPEKEKVEIKYKKPSDTKSVLSACYLHSQHLLDLLEDLCEFSSFDHAEVIAGQITREVEDKIEKLRPNEETEEVENEEAAA